MTLREQSHSKILIVDDVSANLFSLKQLLANADAEIIQAGSGVDALLLCLKHDFALILLDVNMPGMDGFEVAENLRGSNQTRSIPIIFITASYSDEIYQIKGYDAGAVDYITKPINDRVLLSKVKVFLELDEQRRLLGMKANMLDVRNWGLEKEIVERQRAEEALLKITQSRITRQLILQTAFEPFTFSQQLQKALEIILDMPWLADTAKGAIFLTDMETGNLVLTAQRNLPECMLKACASVAPGYCLCGRAAKARKLLFANEIDHRYDIKFNDVEPHGYYCVPILQKDSVLGVLNLHVEAGRVQDSMIDDLLVDIAHTLARIIDRRQMDDALQQAKKVAEEASHAKGRFLATMSHEIRTPLNGIIGFAQLLAAGELDAKQKQYVELIQKSGDHLLSLIGDILDFSKIEADGITLEEIPFDLDEFLEKTVGFVTPSAEKKGLELLVECSPRLPRYFSGDFNRLRQILLNLLSNAIKFTARGRVVLKVERLQEEECRLLVCFSVCDSGDGITPEQAKNLFQPFGQGDTSTTRKYGGTGLGLVIATRLAQMMGGGINMESVSGQGSQFHATVWLKKQAQGEQPALMPTKKPQSLPTSMEDYRVLVVEDDEINRLFIVDYLNLLGYQSVDIAHDGKMSLKMLEANGYDVVLMDCQMPEMDGYQATGEIRLQNILSRRGARLPVIALTANALAGDREKCLAAGMDDFLTKPLDVKELEHTLARWLSQQSDLSPPPLDHAGFAQLRQLFGEEKLVTLVRVFLDTLPEKVAQVKGAMEQQNPEALHQIAHILKGNSGMIKAPPLLETCQKLVELGRSGNLQGADILVVQLVEQSEKLALALEECIAS